jgi:hypothetical protein
MNSILINGRTRLRIVVEVCGLPSQHIEGFKLYHARNQVVHKKRAFESKELLTSPRKLNRRALANSLNNAPRKAYTSFVKVARRQRQDHQMRPSVAVSLNVFLVQDCNDQRKPFQCRRQSEAISRESIQMCSVSSSSCRNKDRVKKLLLSVEVRIILASHQEKSKEVAGPRKKNLRSYPSQIDIKMKGRSNTSI